MTNLASTFLSVAFPNLLPSNNALERLKRFLGFEERKVLINSFILSDFGLYLFWSYIVWSISSAKSLNKIENLRK